MTDKPTFRCSSLDRIINCIHSTTLPKFREENVYAVAGTKQHKLAEKALTSNQFLEGGLNENTRTYVNYIKNCGSSFVLENHLKHDFGEYVLQGSPDCFFVENRTLNVVDLKNGHLTVEPDCAQLLGYATLLSHSLKSSGWEFDKIVSTIVQHEKLTHTILTQAQLDGLHLSILKSIQNKSFKTGTHCRFCESKIHCPKMIGMVTTVKNTDVDISDLTEEELFDIIKNKRNIELTLESLKAWAIGSRERWFKKQQVKLKEWIDPSLAPTDSPKRMTPAKALREGLSVQSNIKIKEGFKYVCRQSLTQQI